MHDGLRDELTAALEQEGHADRPDLEWVVRRGTRVRTVRATLVMLVAVAVVGAGVGSAALLGSEDDARPQPATTETPEPGQPVVEVIPEDRQAEIFALRALNSVGLVDPLAARTYTGPVIEYTTRTLDGWIVAFYAGDCRPETKPLVFKGCRSLTPDREGPDTFVVARLSDETWRVVEVTGAMPADDRNRVAEFEWEERPEPSHFEVFDVGIFRNNARFASVHPHWVGPYPTSALGSVCRSLAFDEAGATLDRGIFYLPAPDDADERSGFSRGAEIETDRPVADVEVQCRQYTGPGWELKSDPEILGHLETPEHPALISGVTAVVEWKGPKGFTAWAKCTATLVDQDGRTVWQDYEWILDRPWPPDHDYPYETKVTVSGGRIPQDEVAAPGEFACETY